MHKCALCGGRARAINTSGRLSCYNQRCRWTGPSPVVPSVRMRAESVIQDRAVNEANMRERLGLPVVVPARLKGPRELERRKTPSAEIIEKAARILLPGEDVRAETDALSGSVLLRWVVWPKGETKPTFHQAEIRNGALRDAACGINGPDGVAQLVWDVVSNLKRSKADHEDQIRRHKEREDASLPGDCCHPGCEESYPRPKDLSGGGYWCREHGCQAVDGYCYDAEGHEGPHWYLNCDGERVEAPLDKWPANKPQEPTHEEVVAEAEGRGLHLVPARYVADAKWEEGTNSGWWKWKVDGYWKATTNIWYDDVRADMIAERQKAKEE